MNRFKKKSALVCRLDYFMDIIELYRGPVYRFDMVCVLLGFQVFNFEDDYLLLDHSVSSFFPDFKFRICEFNFQSSFTTFEARSGSFLFSFRLF